jgi:prepilin-type N-terminal cleavage/methylation domain-containing protein
MSRRGFTLVELAIVLAIAALIMPICYALIANVQDQSALAWWQMETADGVRSLAEELRLDARRGVSVDGDEVGFVVDGCDVRYRVTDAAALVRDAGEGCGAPRGLAAYVESIAWSEGGVDVTFARRIRPKRTHRTTIFIPVQGR